MDPNETLRLIVEAAQTGDREAYIQGCDNLAEWLEHGGLRPAVPEGTSYIPGAGTPWSLSSPAADIPFWRLVYWGRDGAADKTFRLN